MVFYGVIRWRRDLGKLDDVSVKLLSPYCKITSSTNNDTTEYKLCFHIIHNYIAITERYNKSSSKSLKVITNYEGRLEGFVFCGSMYIRMYILFSQLIDIDTITSKTRGNSTYLSEVYILPMSCFIIQSWQYMYTNLTR